ncbi:hypothetical protein FJT64_016941 [Amphibalanus amphitrite]|uniref:Uncharacterized protein n=1 Tax=Amphibalanus amphitrite TaxID=1232801 RepID=A0A6A4W7M7_AMPAM|nr:hypothetical protein FJT64_008056 [Amphibalanus amphitrite]KAF0299754.1 hypothetical protein FJT64_027588 [Amphibalanus amphitrite]KAF0312342.1 hypothetical protein FJT64_016941 [Amphibalanus amphitrite]
MDGEENQEQTSASRRQVRLTEAGREHQKEMKTKVFKRQLKELKRHTEKMVEDDGTIAPDLGKPELKEYTGGEARTVIEGFLLLRSADAYNQAKKKLYDRYGNDFIVSRTYRKKLKEWPPVRAGDGSGLRRLADYLDSCLAVSHHVSGLESLNDCNQNNEILRKLPKHIVDKWRRVVDKRLFEPDAGTQPGYPPFEEFRLKREEHGVDSGEEASRLKRRHSGNSCNHIQGGG